MACYWKQSIQKLTQRSRKKSAVNEQESLIRSTEKRSNAKDAQHDTTTHSVGTGVASFPDATRKTTQVRVGRVESEDQQTSKYDEHFCPVVKELNTAYDAA